MTTYSEWTARASAATKLRAKVSLLRAALTREGAVDPISLARKVATVKQFWQIFDAAHEEYENYGYPEEEEWDSEQEHCMLKQDIAGYIAWAQLQIANAPVPLVDRCEDIFQVPSNCSTDPSPEEATPSNRGTDQSPEETASSGGGHTFIKLWRYGGGTVQSHTSDVPLQEILPEDSKDDLKKKCRDNDTPKEVNPGQVGMTNTKSEDHTP